MINEMTIFFNKNPVLGIILIGVLFVLLYYITQKHSSEHLDQVTNILPQCTINTDQNFYNEFVEQSHVLNFKCNVKGIDYYLASVKKSDYTTNVKADAPDCVQSMLILIPATEIQTMLQDYLNQMKTARDICNATTKIHCNNKPGSECPETYDVCNLPRFFLHDFNVIDVSPQNPDYTKNFRKYIINGTAVPSLNGISSKTMFNTFLLNDSGVNMVCGDTYAYGAPNQPKHFAEVIISERIAGNSGGVVGSDSGIKIKIRFNALQQLISQQNNKTVRTPLIDTCSGEPKTRPVYLGVCLTETCTKENNTYPRICVYDDISDPNVLEFSPAIVSNNIA